MKKPFTKHPVADATLPSKETLKSFHGRMKTANNKNVLRSLFIESANTSIYELDSCRPMFTLKDHNISTKQDGNDVILYSLKNVYFSYSHIPGFEYDFAKDVFNSWDHWVELCNSSNIVADAIASWREELTIKLQAKAFSSLLNTATYEGAKGTPAARFLADRGWEVKRGRPSKEEVARERKIAASVNKEVNEDMERLGLTLVKTA